jgi:asparagine synthase (glutamine-hydrolysing)
MAKAAAKVTNVVLNGEGGDPCFGRPKNIHIFGKVIGAAPIDIQIIIFKEGSS